MSTQYTYELAGGPQPVEHQTTDPATVRAAMKDARATRFKLKRLVVEPPYVTRRYEKEFK